MKRTVSPKRGVFLILLALVLAVLFLSATPQSAAHPAPSVSPVERPEQNLVSRYTNTPRTPLN